MSKKIVEEEKRVMMPTYARLPVAFVRGEGARLWDSEGNEYLDLLSGIGTCILGHCHPAVSEAVISQAEKLIHTTNLYYIIPQLELAQILVKNSFGDRVFFCNSGAEANETALKLARKYHFSKGARREKVVCLEGSFHGRSIATLQATGQKTKWEPFLPLVDWIKHVPLNDIEALRDIVDGGTAAVLLEPIQGETGVRPVNYEFLEAAREACDETGALLIFDEIQTGLGRTGQLFAYIGYDIVPDIMTLAKGLANGIPIGAVLAKEEVGTSFEPGDHGTTFGGNHLATAAGVATMRTLLERDVIANVREMGKRFHSGLDKLVKNSELAVRTRGLGLMLAVDLEGVSSREVTTACLEEGLVVNDVTPSTIRFLPPFIITEEEVEEALDIMSKVLSSLESKRK